jgi:hypothetical protein
MTIGMLAFLLLAVAAFAERPNILLVLSDDHSVAALRSLQRPHGDE